MMRCAVLSTFRLLLVSAAACSTGAVRADTPYLGEIRCGIWDFAPKGWAMLAGQLLPINQNQALFSLLQTNYGGDGRVTFQLPDMRGRVLLTAGQRPGLSSYQVGDRGGSETMPIGTANLPAHTHSVALPGSASEGDTQSPAGKSPASHARTALYAAAPGNLAMAPAEVSFVGGGQPVNNMQPYVSLTCVIALQGIYPSFN